VLQAKKPKVESIGPKVLDWWKGVICFSVVLRRVAFLFRQVSCKMGIRTTSSGWGLIFSSAGFWRHEEDPYLENPSGTGQVMGLAERRLADSVRQGGRLNLKSGLRIWETAASLDCGWALWR
jgi:hypothetical protein